MSEPWILAGAKSLSFLLRSRGSRQAWLAKNGRKFLEIFRTNGKKTHHFGMVKLCQTVSFAGTIKHDGKKLAVGLKMVSIDRNFLISKSGCFLHPGRSTWNIIMEVWKIIFLSKWVIRRFQPLIFLVFQGVTALMPKLRSDKLFKDALVLKLGFFGGWGGIEVWRVLLGDPWICWWIPYQL